MKGAIFKAISGCEGESIEPSLYVLNVDGDYFLLDVGYGDAMDIGKVLTQLKGLRIMSPLKGILVTHAHLDHVGLLPHVYKLLCEFEDVPIVMTQTGHRVATCWLTHVPIGFISERLKEAPG